MLDKWQRGRTAAGESAGAPRDFQEHLARLEARGLLTRIDRPINKDTELHPLARWQFQGGLPESERRAFLFTNVVDSSGRRYDMRSEEHTSELQSHLNLVCRLLLEKKKK